MRVLVRVPEAYLLLRPFEATRPGLLVLDADGRRVADIPLTGTPDATQVAAMLIKARDATPRERTLVRVPEDTADVFAKQLRESAGKPAVVLHAGGFVELRAAPGTVTPLALAAMAKDAKLELEVIDPVRVALERTRGEGPMSKAAATVPGVRHVDETASGCIAWVSRWLLHPERLAHVGLKGDVASVVYRFESLPTGVRVVGHLRRPFAEKGVLSVVPRVAENAIEVIVRPKDHDPKKTRAVLVAGGLKPKP